MSAVGGDRLLELIGVQNEIAVADLDLDEVMCLVAERAQALTCADAAVVEIAEGDDLVYRVGTGEAHHHLGLRLSVGASLSGLCVRTGQVLRSDDTTSDPRVDADAVERIGARSMICVPLVHREAPVGVLKVYAGEAGRFDDEDVHTLRLLSGLIAAQMQHATEFAAVAHESRHDGLTGLMNRRAYDERLGVELARARRYRRPLSLGLMDVDGFKVVNDSHGHDVGDAVLRDVAQILRGHRAGDEVFRVGGDEFAVMLPETRHAGAEVAVARLAGRVDVAGLRGALTVSWGVAEAEGESAQELHRRADAAMYEMKRRRHQEKARADLHHFRR